MSIHLKETETVPFSHFCSMAVVQNAQPACEVSDCATAQGTSVLDYELFLFGWCYLWIGLSHVYCPFQYFMGSIRPSWTPYVTLGTLVKVPTTHHLISVVMGRRLTCQYLRLWWDLLP